jgi:Leucine-rich repeat (LRR) protein
MKKYIIIVGVIIVLAIVFFVGQGNKIYAPQTDDVITSITNSKVIDLSGRGLKSIPNSIFNEIKAEELNVSNNSLTGSIQSQVGQLTKLRILNASNNLMTGVPAEIGQLKDLQVLDLSNNKLTGLPNELGNLSNLKTLNLSGNQYSKTDLDYIRSKLPTSVNIIIN